MSKRRTFEQAEDLLELPDLLPNTLGHLIEAALLDLQSIEADPKYRVNMRTWHSPKEDGVCEVCMAGAVLAGTYRVSRRQLISDGWMFALTDKQEPTVTLAKLRAVDWVQAGNLDNAIYAFYGSTRTEQLYAERCVTLDWLCNCLARRFRYVEDSDEFFKQTMVVAKRLQEMGI